MIKRYSGRSISRKKKIRAKLRKISQRLRLSVFRSHRYISAQVIDDKKGKTLVAVLEKELKVTKASTKIDRAYALGEILAQKALKKKIKKVYFDRGRYKYHGRVKALAEGAKKGGLSF